MKIFFFSIFLFSTTLMAQSTFETSLKQIEEAEKEYAKVCVAQNNMLKKAYKETNKPLAEYTYAVLLNEKAANDLLDKINPEAFAHHKYINERYALLEKTCDEANVYLIKKSLDNESICDTQSVETIFFHSMISAAKEKNWSRQTIDKLASKINSYSEKMLKTDFFDGVNYLSAHNLMIQFAEKFKDKKTAALAKKAEEDSSILLDETMKVEPELSCSNVIVANKTRTELRKKLKSNLATALKVLQSL